MKLSFFSHSSIIKMYLRTCLYNCVLLQANWLRSCSGTATWWRVWLARSRTSVETATSCQAPEMPPCCCGTGTESTTVLERAQAVSTQANQPWCVSTHTHTHTCTRVISECSLSQTVVTVWFTASLCKVTTSFVWPGQASCIQIGFRGTVTPATAFDNVFEMVCEFLWDHCVCVCVRICL